MSTSHVAETSKTEPTARTPRTRKPSIKPAYAIVRQIALNAGTATESPALGLVTGFHATLEDALDEMQTKKIVGTNFAAIRIVPVKGKASFSVIEQQVISLKIG